MRGILLMIGAVTVFTVMTSFIKVTAGRVPAGEAVFFRSVMALPVIMIWLASQGKLRGGLATERPWGHVVRGFAGTIAMGLGFAGLAYLPLPEVTAIRFVTPILMVILAALILGEKFRMVRMSAVTIGLIGVIVILWPNLGGTSESAAFGAFLVLGSAGFAAFAQVFVKSMAGREKTAAIVFYFSMTATLLSLLTIPFGWVVPTPRELAFLVGAGLIGGVGQILLTSSYRFADAGVLAPFTYVSMLWAIVIGYFVFNEEPTASMLSGAALIIGAGVLIVWRERQLGIKRLARRKVEVKGLQ